MSKDDFSLCYRFLTGKDDANFCRRVSESLEKGYKLYGQPTMVVKDGEVYVGQVVVREHEENSINRGTEPN